MTDSISHRIATEVPVTYLDKLLDFIYAHYLSSQKERFTQIHREKEGETALLSYIILDSMGNELVKIDIKGVKPIEVQLAKLSQLATKTVIEQAKQDIVIAMQLFEEKARKTTLYFAWREGEKIVPEEFRKKEKSLQRLFLETQILFFIIFVVIGMVASFVLLSFFPDVFFVLPLVIIAVQFVFVFYSPSIISRTADWIITESDPFLHILEYHLPLGDHDELSRSIDPNQVLGIKKEIYDQILAKKGEIDCEAAHRIFSKYGIACLPENLSVNKINVYSLVKRIADKFGFKIPKVLVSNTMIPNAAASGPSPNRGVVLVTTGLFVQLEEAEVLSVLGHEFGHLRGRDHLILYGLTSGEFLFRFYVLFPFFPYIFSTFLFFVYFWAVMILIFFIAKFFEARADLVSAMEVGNPEVLARA